MGDGHQDGPQFSYSVSRRRLQKFCLDMNWLPWPLIPEKQWPKPRYKEKCGITLTEHKLFWRENAIRSGAPFIECFGILADRRVIWPCYRLMMSIGKGE